MDKLILLTLIALGPVSLLSNFELDWSEILRIALIVIGLGFVPGWRRGSAFWKKSSIEDNPQLFEVQLILVMSCVFLVFQFDPSAEQRESERDWIFWALVILLVGVGNIKLVWKWISEGKGNLRDRVRYRDIAVVVSTLFFVLLILILSNEESGRWLAVKVVIAVAIYFLVTKGLDGSTAIGFSSNHNISHRNLLIFFVWFFLGVNSLGSGARWIRAEFELRKAMAHFESGDLVNSARLYAALRDDFERLDLIPVTPKRLEDLIDHMLGRGYVKEAIELQKWNIHLLQIKSTETITLSEAYYQLGMLFVRDKRYEKGKNAFNLAAHTGNRFGPVLVRLREEFRKDEWRSVTEELWGEAVFVAVYDFERGMPKLLEWAGNVHLLQHQQSLVKSGAHSGDYAAYLEADYQHQEVSPYHYWKIPFQADLNHPIGLRVFLRNKIGWKGRVALLAGIDYKHTSGVLRSSGKIVNKEWVLLTIEDLFAETRKSSLFVRSSIPTLVLIGLDTHGETCRLFIDDLQFYLPL